jgi:hypothetical protein
VRWFDRNVSGDRRIVAIHREKSLTPEGREMRLKMWIRGSRRQRILR